MTVRRRIRVLHFLNSPQVPGGVEEHVRDLVAALPPERFEVTLVCPSSSYFLFAPLAAPHRQICPLDLFKPLQVKAIWRLLALLRRRKIEIAHSHQFYATLFLAPLAKLCRVAWVIETTHVREAWRRSWIKRSFIVDRLVYRLVNRFIAVSYANEAYLVKKKHCSPEKVVVIHNGRNLKEFSPSAEAGVTVRERYGIPSSEPLLVHVGRLEHQKGQHVLLRAMPSIREAIPNVKVLLVGEGRSEAALQEEVRRLGLGETVMFAGRQNSVRGFLEAADLVVLPSLWEGLPLVPIEAGAMRKAVVASRVDGVPEVVVDGETGVLVPPDDSHQLSDAIIALLHDEERRRRMGDAAVHWVQTNFSLEAQVERTAQLYESLAGTKEMSRQLRVPCSKVPAESRFPDEQRRMEAWIRR